ncbi:MAG: SIMPL domain-containing protein [Flavobacterium sp.]|nr:SIMPL domain-containing protein [Pedobacter sp.]
MRLLLTISFISLFCFTAFSQNLDSRRKIEVTGSAEAEVTPDIIYIGISLKEYFKDNSNRKKVEIEELERQLQKAVLDAGIAKENFTINNISSYTDYWNKKKDPNFFASKQYKIKVADLTKLNQIFSGVDSKGISYTNIEGYDYSKMESLKKDLKIKALLAAKDKATYLTAAIGQKVGAPIEIQEINNEYYPQPMYRANTMVKADGMTADAEIMPEIDFKKIKLNYQMRTVFEVN